MLLCELRVLGTQAELPWWSVIVQAPHKARKGGDAHAVEGRGQKQQLVAGEDKTFPLQLLSLALVN